MEKQNRLDKLEKLKVKIEKEIEHLKDQIYFREQEEKTEIAKQRLNKWFIRFDSYVKIKSITGNTYKTIILTDSFEYCGIQSMSSEDYFPEDYKECTKEEVKQIEIFFDLMK